jgi:hypothetical protein
MRTVSFLLLIVYVAGHTGLPLPLPGGASVAGACGCGDTCQCAQATVAAGNCCCARPVRRDAEVRGEPTSCCAAKAETDSTRSERRSCCASDPASSESCEDEACGPPVLRSCGCQQDVPEGIAVCNDPRVLSEAIGPPGDRNCDWLPTVGSPVCGLLVQSPDDPVPRLMA